jgi:hypothetical protein
MMANFPWETVFRHLFPYPRSLILMQMVDKNLAGRLQNDHALWVLIFKRHLFRCVHTARQVHQTRYPALKLNKVGLTGIPMHTGPVKGDIGNYTFPDDFEAQFTAYARKAFALKFGHRCGLCGCRWHHEPFWSLGMRVCKLCMSNNLLTAWDLLDRYGTHYADITGLIGHGRVFYFYHEFGPKQDHLPPHGADRADLAHRRSMWVFWRPHLELSLDLPALYAAQKERKRAAAVLTAVARRARVTSLRRGLENTRGERRWYSTDKLLMELYRDERRRLALTPWRQCASDLASVGGAEWGFLGYPHCGKSRHEHLHGESRNVFSAFMFRWEDCGPLTLGGGSI